MGWAATGREEQREAWGSSGGVGGSGGDGIRTSSGGASIIGATGAVILNGTGGEAAPASLAAGSQRPNTEGSTNGTGIVLGPGFNGKRPLQRSRVTYWCSGWEPILSPTAMWTALCSAARGSKRAPEESIDIRGRAETAGASSRGVAILASTIETQSDTGAIVISGEAQGPGMPPRIMARRLGVESQGNTVIGGPATSGNIVIRANGGNGDSITNGGNGDSIDISANTVIQTTGVVNLRPGGVSAAGELTAADAEPIEIADRTSTNTSNFTFRLSPAELGTIQDRAPRESSSVAIRTPDGSASWLR